MRTWQAFVVGFVISATAAVAGGRPRFTQNSTPTTSISGQGGVTSPLVVAVIDAGVLNVQGDETVAGALTCAGTVQGNDLQVPDGRALYLDAPTRSIGLTHSSSATRVLGADPLTPNADQGINLGSAAVQWSYFFLGGQIINSFQTITGTDDGAGTNRAVTITPNSGNIKVDCQDTQGCDVTMSETSQISGSSICITMIGTGTTNFADTSGVSELAGAFAAGQWDVICMRYVTDRWVETNRSNN